MDKRNNSEEDSDLDELESEEEQAEAKACYEPSRSFVELQSMHEKTSTFFNQSIVKAIDKKQDIQPSPKVILNGRNFKSIHELSQILSQINNLTTLKIIDCTIKILDSEVLPPISTLKYISFENCIDNIFKAFIKQNALTKIKVSNDDLSFNRFPHDIFNEICGKCKNLEHVVLDGIGTGSYFDSDDFPYTIKKLETSMITFNWYVGLKNARVNFLESQKGSLKELTIHELPYDFDGGKVLKYIIEEMDLETFYYRKIPLILNGKKQEVKEFEASEIQISSAIEIMKQFKCQKFILKLSNRELSVDYLKKFIDSVANIFNDITEFEVIDNSCGLFGVFVELYVKFTNLEKLTFRTNNRNINKILECLPLLPNLEEIQLTSTAPRASERYQTILKFAQNLKIIKLPDNFVGDAQGYFGDRVNVAANEEANAPSGLNTARENEGDESRRNTGGGDEDDGDDGNDYGASIPEDIITRGIIEEKNGQFQVHSDFQNYNIDDATTLYVHPYGYPQNVVTVVNKCELKRLIKNEGFKHHMHFLIIQEGKFVVKFPNNRNDLSNEFKRKMDALAYRLLNKTKQLPLLTLAANLRIKVYCCFDEEVDWDMFIRRIPFPNGVSASLWMHHESVRLNNGYQIWFFIDAIDYSTIQLRGNLLNFKGIDIDVHVVEDPFRNDIETLPE